jgi:hypothetical protein
VDQDHYVEFGKIIQALYAIFQLPTGGQDENLNISSDEKWLLL